MSASSSPDARSCSSCGFLESRMVTRCTTCSERYGHCHCLEPGFDLPQVRRTPASSPGLCSCSNYDSWESSKLTDCRNCSSHCCHCHLCTPSSSSAIWSRSRRHSLVSRRPCHSRGSSCQRFFRAVGAVQRWASTKPGQRGRGTASQRKHQRQTVHRGVPKWSLRSEGARQPKPSANFQHCQNDGRGSSRSWTGF